MRQTSKTQSMAIKGPLAVLGGLLSRMAFIAFLPIGIYLLLKAAIQKIRGVEPSPALDSSLIFDPELIGQKYFHQGHTWAMATTNGTVAIGLDEFTQKVMGDIEKIEMPQIGRMLRQGRAALTLRHGQRELPLVSPVDGTVVEVNSDIERDPTLANRSPYDQGWIFRVRPARLKDNLRNLLHGQLAEKWMEMTKSQFVQQHPLTAEPVYQDGGELVDGVGEMLSDAEWELVKREFFIR